jgi:DNA polymerase-3 subunit epsilon
LDQLPYSAGVYYFKDKAGKIVYVGKAKNLKYRVRSHFANNSSSRRKQEFIRNIHHISFQPCVTELHALVLEELEIKKLWPLYNRSQKRYSQLFGLYELQDQRGLTRLAVEKRRKHRPAIVSFHQLESGYLLGRQILHRFDIDEQLLFVTGNTKPLLDDNDIRLHNQKMNDAIIYLRDQQPSLHIFQRGESQSGAPQVIHYFIQKGMFAGMLVTNGYTVPPAAEIMDRIEALPDNEYVKAMLFRFAASNNENVIELA